jgi:hypothetical protein
MTVLKQGQSADIGLLLEGTYPLCQWRCVELG